VAAKKKAPAVRPSSPAPHVRIADQFYWFLSNLTPQETKLYLAFRFLAWRKDGRKKGHIGKSLRRIAREISMAYSTAHRALHGLQNKNLIRQTAFGFVLLEPSNGTLQSSGSPRFGSFDNPVDTSFDTPLTAVGGGEDKAKHYPNRIGVISERLTPIQIGYPTPNNPSGEKGLQRGETIIDPYLLENAPSASREDAARRFCLTERGEVNDTKTDEPLSAVEAKQRLEELRRRAREAIAIVEESQKKTSAPQLETNEEQATKEAKRIAELKRQAAELEREEKNDNDE